MKFAIDIKVILVLFLVVVSTFESKRHKTSNSYRNSYRSSRTNGHTEIRTHGRCTNGFGYAGRCLSDAYSFQNVAKGNTNVSDFAKNTWNKDIIGILNRVLDTPQFCMGDFKGEDVKPKLGTFKCNAIPWAEKETFGFFGLHTPKIACGKPTNVDFCFGFDTCGTMGIAISGGTIKCFAYGTGIGGIIAEAGDLVTQASFALSYHRKVERAFEVTAYENDAFVSKKVTVKGHFFVQLGLGLPKSYLSSIKINGKGADEYIGFGGVGNLIIDFGNVGDTASKLMDDIRFERASAKSILNTITSSGAEMAVAFQASLTLKLKDLTKGFLPDLSFNFGEINALITLGGGNSGLPTGFFFRFTADAVQNLLKAIEGLTNYFKGILDAIGFSMPNLSDYSKTVIGLTVNTEAIGFEISGYVMTIKCAYSFKSQKGGCQFGSKLFSAVADGAKWVIKQVDEFFSSAGREIGRVAANAAKFAEDVANTAWSGLKEIGNAIEKGAEKVWDAMTSWKKLKRKMRRLRRKLRKMRKLRKLRRRML